VQEINVIDSATILFEGINGYGQAKINEYFTWHDMFIDILQLDPKRDADKNTINYIKSKVIYSINSSENLSNGDTITVTATYNNEDVRKYGIKFIGTQRDFVVAGLDEIQDVDLFSDVSATYSGYAPFGRAQIENVNPDKIKGIPVQYSVDKTQELKNGDTITVTAEIDTEALRRKGYAPLAMSKEFTVSGLDKILTDVEQIDDSMLESLEKEHYSIVEELFTRKEEGLRYYLQKMCDYAQYSGDEELKEAYSEAIENFDKSPPTYSPTYSIMHTKTYLLSSKIYDEKDAENYIIFEYKVHFSDSVAGERDLYWYFRNICLFETPEGVQYKNERYYVYSAFFDKDMGYDKITSPMLDKYNVSVWSFDE
jgi:predicted ThiF/HesA family dinucleotide-utilizing enzyme